MIILPFIAASAVALALTVGVIADHRTRGTTRKGQHRR